MLQHTLTKHWASSHGGGILATAAYVGSMVVCVGVFAGMVLGRIFGEVFLLWSIVKSEHFLGFGIKKPKTAHFHRTRMLSLDGVAHYPYISGVDGVYGDGQLGVSHFLKG